MFVEELQSQGTQNVKILNPHEASQWIVEDNVGIRHILHIGWRQAPATKKFVAGKFLLMLAPKLLKQVPNCILVWIPGHRRQFQHFLAGHCSFFRCYFETWSLPRKKVGRLSKVQRLLQKRRALEYAACRQNYAGKRLNLSQSCQESTCRCHGHSIAWATQRVQAQNHRRKMWIHRS